MNKAIQFLEELGQNADIQLDKIDFSTLLENEDFDPKIKAAILNRDERALQMLLDARTKIVCMLIPAEEEEEKQDDEKDSPKPDEQNVRVKSA